jgi:hypothetical protein
MISTADVVEHLCGGVSAEHAPERLAQIENGRRLPAPQQTVGKHAEMVTTTSLPLLSKRKAEKFAADYIKNEKDAGRLPTMIGLEAKWKEAGLRGGREPLRTAFREIMGDEVTRGRPRKSPTKEPLAKLQ